MKMLRMVGDIATVQGYAGKDYSTNYEIVYSIQNPDKGLPTSLYKALVVAKNKGLIGNETRWDEADYEVRSNRVVGICI